MLSVHCLGYLTDGGALFGRQTYGDVSGPQTLTQTKIVRHFWLFSRWSGAFRRGS